MHVKFSILFEDGTIGESHDASWNIVHDHANFLPPNSDKKWVEYALITDDQPRKIITVNFHTGCFRINGTIIHPAGEEGNVLTYLEDKQSFPDVSKEWQIFNGYEYFPIVGRRTFKGWEVDATLPFCGWKRKLDNKTIQKLCFIYPNGQIVLT